MPCNPQHKNSQKLNIASDTEALTKISAPQCQSAKLLFQKVQKEEQEWSAQNAWIAPPAEIIKSQNLFESTYRKCELAVQAECKMTHEKISLQKLNELFNKWKNNKLYRMPSPNVHCYRRAYLLAEELTKLGYEAKLVKITSKGPFIAITNDKAGTPNGFIDYAGKDLIGGPH